MLIPQISAFSKAKGFTLVEFIISAALSLAAILAVTSIYITSFKIDSKTIQYSRLHDEVTTIMALLSEDIKRAGYVGNSETILTQLDAPGVAGNPIDTRCAPVSTGCSDSEFRKVVVTNDETCILFAYDFDDDGNYDSPDEAFGYRIKNGRFEARQEAEGCGGDSWLTLTDSDFVLVSDLEFKCKVSDDGDDDDYEPPEIDDDGNIINIELNCAAGNLPYAGDFNGTVTVDISFTATLVDDSAVSITTSEKILVRNVSYD